MSTSVDSIPFINLQAQYACQKDRIESAVAGVIESQRFILGSEVSALEEELARFVGSRYCVACSSGTDALLLALLAIGVGPGDEVIVPAFSFFATSEVVSLRGAVPVFHDIELEGYGIDIAGLEERITPRTRAIVAVGLYGQAADIDEIEAVARRHGVPLVEDAAQSFGAPYGNRRSGALGSVSCASFFPAKPLGCYGDGGAVFTDNEELAEEVRMLMNHGQRSRYDHHRIGINGRMDALQAAILRVKLEDFPQELASRSRIASRYLEALQGIPSLQIPALRQDRGSNWAQFTVRVRNRAETRRYLDERGVPTAVHYPSPLYRQVAHQELHVDPDDYPNAEKASQEVFSLPFCAYLNPEHQDHVVETLRAALGG